MATHELKVHTRYFRSIALGVKDFEIRKADRNFQVGDILYLREWENEYTGESCYRKITYILPIFSENDIAVGEVHEFISLGKKVVVLEYKLIGSRKVNHDHEMD